MITIYKICPAALWAQAERDGAFRGAPVDLADGYIHFSTADQVEETARKHFAGQSHLLLVSVEAEALGDALKWEPSRGPCPSDATAITCSRHFHLDVRISVAAPCRWAQDP